MPNSVTLLVVDDEELNRVLVNDYLSDLPYTLVNACSGNEALQILDENPTGFDLVLLDKIMAGLSGMDVLKRIKSDLNLKFLPVILVTADTRPEQIQEGIQAGAYYYLTKPFSVEQLKGVVANALNQHLASKIAHDELSHFIDTLDLVSEMSLNFRCREQAHQITKLLTNVCNLNMVHALGLLELLLNAVEHGNLAITYDEKTQLILDKRLEIEINQRLNLDEYRDKRATVHFNRDGSQLIFTITDQGNGFDWTPYLDMQLERINDNHGRGIAIANKMSFTQLRYLGCGNSVEAIIALD